MTITFNWFTRRRSLRIGLKSCYLFIFRVRVAKVQRSNFEVRSSAVFFSPLTSAIDFRSADMELRSNISFKSHGLLNRLQLPIGGCAIRSNKSLKSYGFEVADCWNKLWLQIGGYAVTEQYLFNKLRRCSCGSPSLKLRIATADIKKGVPTFRDMQCYQ
jgi:hypothetical protein